MTLSSLRFVNTVNIEKNVVFIRKKKDTYQEMLFDSYVNV